ncbi:MAG: hypothetical protein H8E66_24565 [Planctomycetes bacterium]|nr:hypothetical protein [Planctomycetota bacterium]
MLHRDSTQRIARRIGTITVCVLLAISTTAAAAQHAQLEFESLPSVSPEQQPAETVISADFRVPALEANSIIGAVLCFAVGFAACLLVVHYMLPSLVHAQCVEIVREYVDLTKRESDIRVVVLDREDHEPLRKPRRVSVPVRDQVIESINDSENQLRVDNPSIPTESPQNTSTNIPSEDNSDSMLSQIYQQNLHLRDQLRKQSRSVKRETHGPKNQNPRSEEGAEL